MLMDFLAECGIGIEPDTRLWGDPFGSNNFVAYQDSTYNIQSSLTTNYKLSALSLSIAAGMNLIETDITNNEYYDRLVETQVNLTGNEMTRLSAHLRWLRLSNDGKLSCRKLINLVKEDEKERVGRSLIDFSRCQGVMTVQKINRLEDTFRKLSISNELLYSQLHFDQFYSTATRSSRGINKIDKTQPNKESSSNHFALDLKRLAELEIESNNIGGILNNIFQEEPGHHSSRLKENEEKNIPESVRISA